MTEKPPVRYAQGGIAGFSEIVFRNKRGGTVHQRDMRFSGKKASEVEKLVFPKSAYRKTLMDNPAFMMRT